MGPDYEDLHTQIAAAIQQLDDLTETEDSVPSTAESEEGGVVVSTTRGAAAAPLRLPTEALSTIALGLRASLMLAKAGIGECQEDVPYSTMHPVRRKGSSEVEWCCNHKPPHCSGGGGGV